MNLKLAFILLFVNLFQGIIITFILQAKAQKLGAPPSYGRGFSDLAYLFKLIREEKNILTVKEKMLLRYMVFITILNFILILIIIFCYRE